MLLEIGGQHFWTCFQLLLTWFWWNFKGKFLGPSLTDANHQGDICPSNICPYQEYLSCYWPIFDETLQVASWEHLEQIPTKSDKALVNSNQTRSLTLAQLFLIQAWCYTKVKCNENGKCKYKKRGDCNKHCEKYPEGKKIQVMGYCSNNDIRIIPIFSCNKQLKKWRWHFACLFFSAVNFALCNTCTLQH